jgi:hypothetical protein
MNQEAMSIVKRVHEFYNNGGLPGMSRGGSCEYKMRDVYGVEVGRCAVGCLLSDDGVDAIDMSERVIGLPFQTFWNAGVSIAMIHQKERGIFAARKLMDKVLAATGVQRKDMMVLVWMQNIHDSLSDSRENLADLESARKRLVMVLESIINDRDCPPLHRVDEASVNNLREHIHF